MSLILKPRPQTPLHRDPDALLEFREALGMRIIKAREAAGITQLELARRSGVSRPMLSYWESGKFGMHLDRAVTIARALGVTVGWLLGEVV